MLRQRVASDVDSLEELHQRTLWTPGRECIRPTEERRAEKARLFDNATKRYATVKDYVLHRVFRLAAETRGGFLDSVMVVDGAVERNARRSAEERQQGKQRLVRFVENIFPYELPAGTNHWVLWCMLDLDETEEQHGIDDAVVKQEVEKGLVELAGASPSTFQYVWYRNPKPSVLDGITYHVQVFWIA